MRPRLFSLPCLLPALLLGNVSFALQLQVNGQRNGSPSLATSTSLNPREVGTSSLNNSADISYYTDITLNGTTFSVLIDTGSSDLWVVGSVSGAVKTGLSASVSYAVGSVQGNIELANLDFGGYIVPEQAYISASQSSSNPSGQGLIGLGPNSGSNVYAKFDNNTGASVCDRIFIQNTSSPNYITVNLGRTDDPSADFPGNITIGETLDGLDSVTSQPKLEVTTVSIHDTGDQHFQILIDSDGLIGPDNQSISYTTEVDSTSNAKQATAVLDTGFSLSQVPDTVATAFYSRFSGAEYTNVTDVGAVWIVPCDLEVNLTFKIGGVRYPIHPLDATLDPAILNISDVKNSAGTDSCIGLFQPVSFDTGSDPTYDIILGMSFLRNVYALFNYGDFITDNNASARGDPYIQMLSTTDLADAHSDFVNQRLNGVDTTGSQTLNASTSTDSSSSSSHKTLYFGLAIAAGALALLFFVGAFCMRRNKTKTAAAWVPGRSGGAYAQLSNINGPRDNHLASTSAPPYTQYDQRYDHDGEWGQTLYDPAAPGGASSYPLSQYPASQPPHPNTTQTHPQYSNPFEG
ncbi:aspartic peptidase domain-containing protein [Lentinula detonsa]|uniref:Aspartic peptidase domain-containing protein n=1 Tax=Lentinula detonsa TaxID=2804962 RepID=A0AA38UXD8_9AGAR|nr:aspartic peptidase domain-containing protein [Lentinula detonsa]